MNSITFGEVIRRAASLIAPSLIAVYEGDVARVNSYVNPVVKMLLADGRESIEISLDDIADIESFTDRVAELLATASGLISFAELFKLSKLDRDLEFNKRRQVTAAIELMPPEGSLEN